MNRVSALMLAFGFLNPLMATTEMPPQATAYYENATVGLGFLSPEDGVEQFMHFVVENWTTIAQDFNSFAPDLRRKTLVLVASEGLDPHDYVSFISSVCDQVSATRTSADIVKSCLFTKGRKRGFFAVNYNAPEVKVVITKFKRLVPPTSSTLLSFLEAIESGRAKETFLMWQKAKGDPDPELL